MKFQADIYGIITLAGIYHSLAIGLFLIFIRKSRGISSVYLGLSQISGSMLLVSSLMTTTNIFHNFNFLIGVPYPFLFLVGYFSFVYICSITERNYSPGRKEIMLLIGPVLGFFLSTPFYVMSSGERRMYMEFISANHTYQTYDWIIWSLGLLYTWIVITASYIKIKRYRKSLENEYSNTEKIDLSFLTNQSGLLLLCWLVISISSMFGYNRWFGDFSIKVCSLFPAVYLMITGYSYLFNLFQSAPVEKKKNPLKGTISSDEELDRFRIIEEEMKLNRHYLDPDLTLPLLAEKTSFYRNELSEIINQYGGSSFYHYINAYRVEHFKKLLLTDNNSNILKLAFESGFNSKGAFYNAFKRMTGITPSQFQKQTSP